MGHFSIPNLENSLSVFSYAGHLAGSWVRGVSEEILCHKFKNIFKLFSSIFSGLILCIIVTELVPEHFHLVS